MNGGKKARSRGRPGLTLMELLVVMGVFSMTVAMTSAIFIQSNRAQRRVLFQSAAQADLRFVLEAIVREVRGGRIAYGTYAAAGGVSVPTDHLLIESAGGQALKFYVETSPSVCPTGIPKCLAVDVDGQAQSLTSSGIILDDATFFVNPQTDPFSLDEASGQYLADAQPTVTLALKVHSVGNRPEDIVRLDAQTTVASRAYVR